MKERLEAFDPADRRLQYSILEGPLPVKNYLATVAVRSEGSATIVDWSSEFEAAGLEDAQVVSILEGVYESGLSGIRSALGV